MNREIFAGMVSDYKKIFHSMLSAINDELKTDLAISRHVKEKLIQQLILVDGKCWANEQYSSQEWLEISGNAESVQDDVLEDCVLKIFNECDTPVDLANIDACHRLKLMESYTKEGHQLTYQKERCVQHFTK